MGCFRPKRATRKHLEADTGSRLALPRCQQRTTLPLEELRGKFGMASAKRAPTTPTLEELGAMCFSGGLGARCQVGDPDHGDDRKDQRQEPITFYHTQAYQYGEYEVCCDGDEQQHQGEPATPR